MLKTKIFQVNSTKSESVREREGDTLGYFASKTVAYKKRKRKKKKSRTRRRNHNSQKMKTV